MTGATGLCHRIVAAKATTTLVRANRQQLSFGPIDDDVAGHTKVDHRTGTVFVVEVMEVLAWFAA
jgi:hypothetical protein